MVTREQFVRGILEYAQNEVLPPLPDVGKLGVGTFLILGTNRINALADALVQNNLVKSLGVVDESGNIDSDTLISAMAESMSRYTNNRICFDIPILGKMTFTSNDLTKLRNHFNGG